MNSFTRVNHIGIRVNRNSDHRAFYEKLGFEWIVGPVGPEPIAIMIHKESGVTLNLILNGMDNHQTKNVLMDVPDVKHSGITHIALEVTDLDAVQKDLEKNDIEVTERMKLPGNGHSLFVRDPDRNTIEFHQPGTEWWLKGNEV